MFRITLPRQLFHIHRVFFALTKIWTILAAMGEFVQKSADNREMEYKRRENHVHLMWRGQLFSPWRSHAVTGSGQQVAALHQLYWHLINWFFPPPPYRKRLLWSVLRVAGCLINISVMDLHGLFSVLSSSHKLDGIIVIGGQGAVLLCACTEVRHASLCVFMWMHTCVFMHVRGRYLHINWFLASMHAFLHIFIVCSLWIL